MKPVDFIGFAATFIGWLAFSPQVVKILRTKKTKDISLGMYVIFWLGIIFWLSYGILTQNSPITINNVIMLILVSTMLVLKIKYGD